MPAPWSQICAQRMMSLVEAFPNDERRRRAGDAIREARKAQGWTQPHFAEKLTAALRSHAPPGEAQTVGQSAVSRWEQAVNAPEPWKLPVIEEVLDMQPGWLATILYDRPQVQPDQARASALDARLDRVEQSLEEVIQLLHDLDRRIRGKSLGGDAEA